MPIFTISQLLDRVREAHDLKSDYAISKLLNSSTQLIANWRNGRSLPDEKHCQKLAELAGLDPDVLIAQINAQRSKDEDSRAIWYRIAERLQMTAGVAASAVFAVCFATGFVAGDARAASPSESGSTATQTGSKYASYSCQRCQKTRSRSPA